MIDLQMCRAGWFNKLVEKRIPCGCVCVPQAGGNMVVDAGVNCPGGWRAGKYVLGMLVAGLGEVAHETMTLGGQTLPLTALYLDNPAAIYRHYLDGQGEYSYQRAEALPGGDGGENRVVASHGSLVDYIYAAGKALPLLVEFAHEGGLELECMLWGYGRTPIVFKGKTETETERDKQAMQDYGAVAGLWVKAEDERLERICKAWKGAGEIRLHNIATGNTFIAGAVAEDKLLEYMTYCR